MSLKGSIAYVLLILLLLFVSTFFAYQKYIVNEDFLYFSTEEELPDRFDVNSYQI